MGASLSIDVPEFGRRAEPPKTKLNLDAGLVDACRQAAREIARRAAAQAEGKTTVSVERTVARLLGIDGVDAAEVPLPNVLVDHLHRGGGLGCGVGYWLGNVLLQTALRPQQIAEAVARGELDLIAVPRAPDAAIAQRVADEGQRALRAITESRAQRDQLRRGLRENPPPFVYVLTATGNVYEDVVHARAVADNGGDIVAVIRSTAQSLYDYVPFGPTTEGYGGTFATQANFRIMREALDDWSITHGRYVRLSSFCSGLCMPEIAAMGAMEGLDNMVNDALYGILYRDINMRRTLIDQKFSRSINGYFGIVINTGEDNYLRTADATTAAPSVVASQMINYYIARESGVPEEQIAVGNAFEIHPNTTNGLLYEWAQAQLTRELFPRCPVKFMPPTRHMDGNLFRTHACDTLFNLVTVATHQGIQTLGVPTEGVFTPHIHDRVQGLENTRYVFNFARDLYDEISFAPGGLIQERAADVLRGAEEILREIVDIGLWKAIEKKTFGNVCRRENDGKGVEGIVDTDPTRYSNYFADLMSGGRDA
jgi:beta-lysine 5,6-aminomutase alpha subunit